MSVDGIIPNLTASAAVSPYRFVKVSGEMTGAHCATQTDIAIGVSDGSINAFNGTYNAAVGDPIQLQQGNFMQVELGSAGCDAGDLLSAQTDGKAFPSNATDPGAQFHMVAAQTGTANSVVWAFWRPTFSGQVVTDGSTITGNGTDSAPIALV